MATQLSHSSDLAEQRKAKGISLSSIESSTKIGPHFLKAIEAEAFDELPGGVYTPSYLRQFARATGVDEAALVQRYYEKNPPAAVAQPDSSQNRVMRWLREWQWIHAFFHRAPTRAPQRAGGA